jgi:catechol 2,3-dioxygenase-like lactoylglutathione lyase family enzyme
MTTTRFHLGLYAADLARSVRFYRALLGTEPARHAADLARFESDRPPLVVALYPGPQPAGGALNHAGLRLPDAASLVAVQRRLEEAGIATQRQEGVECCYALQTKFWVTDPDRVLWEVYTFEGDLDHSGFDDPPPALAAPAVTTWCHRLPDPVPDHLPHPDGALDEVQLEGTFNADVAPDRINTLLAEAFRALKPSGRVAVRGLVADRLYPGVPDLPGLASVVRRVPVEGEPAAALARAGFAGPVVEALNDAPCFGVSGVRLSELRLTAWKPAAGGAAAVVYKGPFEQVADEDGTVYRRGVMTAVTATAAGRLKAGPAADQFAFLGSTGL